MKKIKYLSTEEIDELFRVVNQDNSRHGARNQAIFYITKYCALRVSEISMITMSDYNDLWHELYCKREKGSYSNTIKIIDNEVIEVFSRYYNIRKAMNVSSNCLFLSQKGTPISRKTLDSLIKKYCKNTNISNDKWHFHSLRHARAIELAEKGLDVKDIQWWLGHKNIMNTIIYLQFTTKQQEALYRKLEEGMKNGRSDKD